MPVTLANLGKLFQCDSETAGSQNNQDAKLQSINGSNPMRSIAMCLNLSAGIREQAVLTSAQKKVLCRSVNCTEARRKRSMNRPALAIAALCAALSVVSGCQAMRSEAPVKIPTTETPQDQVLSKSVRERLLLVKTVDLSTIDVVSSNGTVYLTGTVASLDARQQAIKLAWSVPGVQSVVNALEVQK